MTSLYLTIDEVGEMTGRKTKSCQIRQLKAIAMQFICDADGRPKVLRAQLSTVKTSAGAASVHASPNADALRKAIGK